VFQNTPPGFQLFLEWLREITNNPWVCLEATGYYSEALAEFMCKQQIKVSIINPMRIKNFAKAILARNKNDPLDSRTILQYARVSTDLREYKPRPQAEKALKEIVKLIDLLTSQQSQLKNQLETIQSKLVKVELTRAIKVIHLRIERLEKQLRVLIEQDDHLKVRKNQYKSIQGVGEKTAYRLLAHLPDLSLYQSAKQLAAYAGLSPRQCQSGAYIGITKLSKFGSIQLRNCLYMSAVVAKNHNPHFREFCLRLEKNGLKPKQIVCAIMRKLLHVIFGMHKSGQVFDPKLV